MKIPFTICDPYTHQGQSNNTTLKQCCGSASHPIRIHFSLLCRFGFGSDFFLDADPDPDLHFHFDTYLDSAPQQSDANLQPLAN